MRRWTFAAGAVVLAAAAATTGVLVADAGDDEPAAEESTEPSLVAVERRDLAREEDLDGTIGHGGRRPLVLQADGTLTALPDVGTSSRTAPSSPRSTASR